jgi:hypothetical protein
MYLAHAPISFLANELIQKKGISDLKQNERILIGIAALVFGILPDIDILILMVTKTPTFMHHSVISHAPLFYIAVWGLLKLIFLGLDKIFNKNTKKIFNKQFTDILLNTFLIGTLLHLLGDIFAEDIMLFYPFTTQFFTLFKYTLSPNLFAGYFYSVSFGLEILIVGIFFTQIFKKLFEKNTILKVVNTTIVTIGALFFVFTFTIHFGTYNQNVLYGTNNKPNNDIDYDTLYDGNDMDVNSNGKDNIVDVDIKNLVTQVKKISDSKKWTANASDNSIVEKIKFQAGAMTSFRLISQAYWNLHSPVNPVLRDMLIKDGTIQGYESDYNLLDTFYQYFNTNQLLIPVNKENGVSLKQGAVVFILSAKDEVLNVGIVLEDYSLGIVMPYDKNLKTHTTQDLTNFYKGDEKVFVTK